MRLAALLSSAACIIGGLWMLFTEPANSNSIFGPLLHGVGLYCIGRGIYAGPSLISQWRTREATEWLAVHQGMPRGAVEPKKKPRAPDKPADPV